MDSASAAPVVAASYSRTDPSGNVRETEAIIFSYPVPPTNAGGLNIDRGARRRLPRRADIIAASRKVKGPRSGDAGPSSHRLGKIQATLMSSTGASGPFFLIESIAFC